MEMLPIESLLTRSMTRKEFLLSLGTIFLAITGLTSIYQTISVFGSGKTTKTQQKQFGMGAYGE